MSTVRPSAVAILAVLLMAGSTASALATAHEIAVSPATLPQAAPSGMDPATAAALDAALVQARQRLNAPGLSLAIRLADGTVWTSVTGNAVVPPDARPVTASTAFSAGSITKTFVAALVLQLVDAGKLRLEDRLSRWLPHFPDAVNIRIVQLLSHTSGLRDYFANPEYERLVFGRPRHHWTAAEILALVRQPPYFKPGTGYHYSNTDYVVLGEVVRRVTGMALGRLLRERLLGPLALDHSAFQDVEPVQITSAQAYLRQNHQWVGWSDGTAYRPNTSAATVAWAAGAMLATPADLVRWAHMLYAGQVISTDSLARMVTFNRHDYGLGAERFFTSNDPATAEPMWGHSGSLRGFEAQMWYVPSRDVTIALMSNRGSETLRPVVQSLLATLFGGM